MSLDGDSVLWGKDRPSMYPTTVPHGHQNTEWLCDAGWCGLADWTPVRRWPGPTALQGRFPCRRDCGHSGVPAGWDDGLGHLVGIKNRYRQLRAYVKDPGVLRP